jgi:hypothetical protein
VVAVFDWASGHIKNFEPTLDDLLKLELCQARALGFVQEMSSFTQKKRSSAGRGCAHSSRVNRNRHDVHRAQTSFAQTLSITFSPSTLTSLQLYPLT